MTGALDGKVVVVTGGSRGLGQAMVRGFAAAGASVVIASRKLEACEALAREVEHVLGTPALPVAANVSRWDDCDALADAALDRFGHVDVLVNNAGLAPLYPSEVEVGEALFDKVIGVNLRGPYRLMARLGAEMVAAGGGSMINISSIEATHPERGALPYAAAKAGLEALSAGFMRALGPSVRVNTIRCGLFATDIAKAWGPRHEVDAAARERFVLERIGEPAEIVGAALFLASDASSYCTGTTIRLDGGIK